MPSSARTAGQGHASKALWSILNGLTGVDYAKEVYVSSLHEEYPNPSIQIATDAGPLILGLRSTVYLWMSQELHFCS